MFGNGDPGLSNRMNQSFFIRSSALSTLFVINPHLMGMRSGEGPGHRIVVFRYKS